MTLTACEHPDIQIRAMPEAVVFPANKKLLADGSLVFRDMFECCSQTSTSEQASLDINERADLVGLLLSILHKPPAFINIHEPKPVVRPRHFTEPIDEEHIPLSVSQDQRLIPFPLLRQFLVPIADKYQLAPHIIEALNTHLGAHAPLYAIEVYGLASLLGLSDIASIASRYLHSPPITSYPPDVIRVIPTSESYHLLVLLQTFRTERFKEHLRNEDMFPYKYGECPRHARDTIKMWERKKRFVMDRVHAGSDVAEEMSTVLDAVKHCKECTHGCIRGIEMLRYKCARVPKTIDRIPLPSSPSPEPSDAHAEPAIVAAAA